MGDRSRRRKRKKVRLLRSKPMLLFDNKHGAEQRRSGTQKPTALHGASLKVGKRFKKKKVYAKRRRNSSIGTTQ